ncbi:hypothetical protein J7T55_008221 [Diaporthe amygdali]|uniref:uncharacterized protein n=1 Tax=Phomopsis amygdali TaxID=1214568 RepID=UPI0022FEFEA8|nr:uncharacterized protein J7T55_008221 [Diaporthe amygdali]KAJ0121061.1 hypothetical protein J7T55_008221 [Diaporthe amygdali]
MGLLASAFRLRSRFLCPLKSSYSFQSLASVHGIGHEPDSPIAPYEHLRRRTCDHKRQDLRLHDHHHLSSASTS